MGDSIDLPTDIRPLTDTTPDCIHRWGMGWHFSYGAKVVGRDTGSVFLFDGHTVTPYAVRFKVVEAVDARYVKVGAAKHKIETPYAGYTPTARRELTSEEVEYFKGLVSNGHNNV